MTSLVAGLIIVFNIQGKFGDVKREKGSGLRFPASPFRLRRAGKVQRLNEDKGARGNRKLEGGKMEGNSSPPISTPEFCFGDLQIAAISTVDPIENRVISKCHMIYSG